MKIKYLLVLLLLNACGGTAISIHSIHNGFTASMVTSNEDNAYCQRLRIERDISIYSSAILVPSAAGAATISSLYPLTDTTDRNIFIGIGIGLGILGSVATTLMTANVTMFSQSCVVMNNPIPTPHPSSSPP